MAKYTKNKPSKETIEQSSKVAKATQRPGQTKEQTKLITQGIQKGIEQYKKQQKEKVRAFNKKVKKTTSVNENDSQNLPAEPKNNLLPWVLLIFSWLGFIAYTFLVK